MNRAPSKSASQLIVAIDGPAGAGKSTIARQIAARYGLLNLETGAMYRAFALYAMEHGADLDSAAALSHLTPDAHIELLPEKAGNRVLLNGVEVTQRIREPDVTSAASRVSVHPEVRRWMVSTQRLLGASGGIVMEGRDIGSAVFPDADVKVFLDADAEVRGQRRFLQNGASAPQPAESVLDEIRERDRRDRSRVESPLAPAPGAVIIDSTHLSLDEVVSQVDALIKERLASL